jgi:Tol biopolymer transport system component
MSGTEDVVFEDSLQKYVSSWSPDGRFLLYSADSAGLNADNDVLVLPLSGDRKPVPFQAERFREGFSQFSPDGRWVAYISYESGEAEAFVAPFPGPGGKQQISQGGAGNLRWRPDGGELFYLSPDNTLMAVAVNGKGPTFEVGATRPLFQTSAASVGGIGPYDVSPDGQRFLINTVTEQTESAPITVIVNWTATLQR